MVNNELMEFGITAAGGDTQFACGEFVSILLDDLGEAFDVSNGFVRGDDENRFFAWWRFLCRLGFQRPEPRTGTTSPVNSTSCGWKMGKPTVKG